MKKIYTHKILPVLAICMFVVFTLATSCFAFDVTIDDNTYTVDDKILEDRPYFMLIRFPGYADYYQGVVSSSPIDFTYNSDYKLVAFNATDCITLSSNLNTVMSKFSIYSDTDFPDCTYTSLQYMLIDRVTVDNLSSCIVYSNHDIYYDDTLVFQAPVVGKQIVLAPVMTETTQQGTTLQAEIQTKTLAEILGILPVVMIIIVSLIGLRKALRLLQTLLRSS